jgi:hypothetical protein
MKLGSCQLPPGPKHPESTKPSAPATPTRDTYHRHLILFSDSPFKCAVPVAVLVGQVAVLVSIDIRGRPQGAILERQPDADRSALA